MNKNFNKKTKQNKTTLGKPQIKKQKNKIN